MKIILTLGMKGSLHLKEDVDKQIPDSSYGCSSLPIL